MEKQQLSKLPAGLEWSRDGTKVSGWMVWSYQRRQLPISPCLERGVEGRNRQLYGDVGKSRCYTTQSYDADFCSLPKFNIRSDSHNGPESMRTVGNDG
ncbi:hypothetical protein LDENG_00219780 [Lucifuga dentata]|nr:hypothetical protein LDENG_00219780 [Lucifuga dentata]